MFEELIDKMFEIANYDLTYRQVRGTEFWNDYTMTKDQEEEFKEYLVEYFRKNGRSVFAIQSASSFIGQFSLRIKE